MSNKLLLEQGKKFTQLDHATIVEYIEDFKKLGMNADGVIDIDGLKKTKAKLSMHPTDDELKQEIAQIDTKKTGVIDFEDFLQVQVDLAEGKDNTLFAKTINDRKMADSVSMGLFQRQLTDLNQ